MKLAKGCIAMAVVAAMLVVPSVAAASLELTHPTGTQASVGTPFEGRTVAHANTPTQVTLTTSIGTLSCATGTITGELTKNNGSEVEGNLTTADFAGTHGVTTTGPCAGTGIFGSHITVTPSHTSDETGSLPWCMKAGAADIFTVRGGKCSEAARPLTFTLHGGITCGYEKASVEGTYTTHPSDVIVTVANQVFSRRAGSSAFCAATASLDLAATLSTDGKPTEPIYIDK